MKIKIEYKGYDFGYRNFVAVPRIGEIICLDDHNDLLGKHESKYKSVDNVVWGVPDYYECQALGLDSTYSNDYMPLKVILV